MDALGTHKFAEYPIQNCLIVSSLRIDYMCKDFGTASNDLFQILRLPFIKFAPAFVIIFRLKAAIHICADRRLELITIGDERALESTQHITADGRQYFRDPVHLPE